MHSYIDIGEEIKENVKLLTYRENRYSSNCPKSDFWGIIYNPLFGHLEGIIWWCGGKIWKIMFKTTRKWQNIIKFCITSASNSPHVKYLTLLKIA